MLNALPRLSDYNGFSTNGKVEEKVCYKSISGAIHWGYVTREVKPQTSPDILKFFKSLDKERMLIVFQVIDKGLKDETAFTFKSGKSFPLRYIVRNMVRNALGLERLKFTTQNFKGVLVPIGIDSLIQHAADEWSNAFTKHFKGLV